MPGFTWLQRLWLARNPDGVAFVTYWFGIMSPSDEMVTRRADLWIACTRKPWKLWHRFKHLNVEWTKEWPQRAALLYLDAIVWAFVLGLVIG